jgi:hypothetical protein
MQFNPGDGTPIGYTPDSETSYLGQLLIAYEVLGGDPQHDLQVRSITDPVYLQRGSESTPALMMSNGEPVAQKGNADAVTARLISSMRGWADDSIHRRRDYLERKIRRTIDYSDQLQAEISLLQTIQKDVTSNGSLEKIISDIDQLFSDKSYRAIYDDNGKDVYGKLTYSPFSAYEPGGTRGTAPGPERTENGVVRPGEVEPEST